MTRYCENPRCGKPFQVTTSQKSKRFCSEPCNTWRRQDKADMMAESFTADDGPASIGGVPINEWRRLIAREVKIPPAIKVAVNEAIDLELRRNGR